MPSNIPANANSHGPVNANSYSQGNSLVELVVVVTMLGVFSSFAVPRFTRLENHARASEVVALSVKLRSVAAAANGIRVAIPDPSGFTVNATPTSVTYSKSDAPAPALCAVTYHPSLTASSEATITDFKTSA